MGMHNIVCSGCGDSFHWFSGNVSDQRCEPCKASQKSCAPIDSVTADLLRADNETLRGYTEKFAKELSAARAQIRTLVKRNVRLRNALVNIRDEQIMDGAGVRSELENSLTAAMRNIAIEELEL